jgi:Cys-tRNA(Pro)/Cys-tRNA(Cys) deacylase
MSVTNATRILKAKKIPFDLLEYSYSEKDLSVEKIAVDNDLPVAQIFKTLVAKGDKTGVLVAVVAGNQTLNLKALAKASGHKKIALVSVKDLQGLTGYIRGGCSPVGMKKNFPVFIDEVGLNFDKIYVNAGKRGYLMGVEPNALSKLCQAEFVSIGEEN